MNKQGNSNEKSKNSTRKSMDNNNKLVSGFLYFNEEWNTESPTDDDMGDGDYDIVITRKNNIERTIED